MPQLVSFISYFNLAQSTQKNSLIICDRVIMDVSACKFYLVFQPRSERLEELSDDYTPAKHSWGVYCFQQVSPVLPSIFKVFAL